MSKLEKIYQKLKTSGIDEKKAMELATEIIDIVNEPEDNAEPFKDPNKGGGYKDSRKTFGDGFTSYLRREDI